MKDDESRHVRALALSTVPGVLVAGIGGGMVFPILPLVGLQVGLSPAFIGAILAANRFGRVIVNPAVGRASDLFGPKRIFVFGILLQTLVFGLFWLGLATGHPGPFFLVGRLLHGPASSCVFVGSQTLALAIGGERHRGTASGIVRAAQAAGIPIGFVVGGLLSGTIGPKATFAWALLAPLIAGATAHAHIPDVRTATKREAPRFAAILGSLTNARVGALALINLGSFFAAQGVVLTTLVLLVHERHLALWRLSEASVSSALMTVLILSMVAVAPTAGRLADRPAVKGWLVVVGLLWMIAGLGAIGGFAHTTGTAIGLTLVGLGMGVLTTPVLALLGQLVPAQMLGSAVGALQLFGDLGATLGPVFGMSMLQKSAVLAFGVSAAVLLPLIPIAVWVALGDTNRSNGVEVPTPGAPPPPAAKATG